MVIRTSCILPANGFAIRRFAMKRTSCISHRISIRPISTCQLSASQHLHLKPIYLILSKGSM